MRKQSGFTLIELIVVIFMISMVAAALIYNFRSGDKQKRLNLSRDTVITALRSAQNYSLAGRQIPPTGQAPRVRGNARCTGNDSADSYWVEMSDSSATINLMAEDTCGAVIRVQTFNLVGRTEFLANNPFTLDTGSGATNQDNIAVRFTPPFAVMSATSTANPTGSSFAPFLDATIGLQFQDGSRTTTITADGISGKIE